MTTQNGISYVEYLQRQIAAPGALICCGPPVYDYPTFTERLGFGNRPNAELERQLETQLRELEHQARLQAEAEIEM